MRATNPFGGAVKARTGSGPSSRASPAAGSPPVTHLAAATTLAVTLALAAAVVLFSALLLVTPHSETLEAIWWLAAFAVVAPLGALGAGWLIRATRTPAAGRALTAAAPCALLLLCGALALARVAASLPGRGLQLPGSLLLVVALPSVLLALRKRALVALAARANARALATLGVAAAGVLGVAAFLPAASRGPDVLILALLLAVVAVPAGLALSRRSLHRRVRLAIGILVPLLLALLAWDVSFQVLTSHQDFYLGPANDIRHGRYMLVDDYSQYGVAVIYFLAALLAPLPFGYGTFVLVVGVLSSVMLAAVYLVLRVATRSLPFAALGTFLALTSGSIATIGRTTQYPSTGFLRFGIPWLLVCALVIAYRRDRPALAPLLAAYALVGLAAVWSFETAFYTCATFAVTVVAAAWTRPAGERVRCAANHLAAGAAAVAGAIAVLVTATVVGRGRAPDVSGYLDFLRLYSVAGFGQLPIPGWSLGYLMGALYVASLAAIGAILAYGRGSELGRPSTIVPLAAVSTFGAVALTYFLGRSHPNNLTHVAPPFVVLITLWTALACRAWARDRNPIAASAVALAGACAALLIAQQLPQLLAKAPDSALVAVARSATGGPGLAQKLQQLTDLPVISPHTRTVEALVRRSVPRDAPLLVAVEPAVATETLIRLDRSDVLPIGTPEQDGLPLRRRQTLLRAARRIRCGAYVVTQNAPMTGPGRILLESLVSALRHRHPFRAVARAQGYRVFRLGCGRA
jgi:hypothetical protein